MADEAQDGRGCLKLGNGVTVLGYPYELLDALVCRAGGTSCREHGHMNLIELHAEVTRRLVRDSTQTYQCLGCGAAMAPAQ